MYWEAAQLKLWMGGTTEFWVTLPTAAAGGVAVGTWLEHASLTAIEPCSVVCKGGCACNGHAALSVYEESTCTRSRTEGAWLSPPEREWVCLQFLSNRTTHHDSLQALVNL